MLSNYHLLAIPYLELQCPQSVAVLGGRTGVQVVNLGKGQICEAADSWKKTRKGGRLSGHGSKLPATSDPGALTHWEIGTRKLRPWPLSLEAMDSDFLSWFPWAFVPLALPVSHKDRAT